MCSHLMCRNAEAHVHNTVIHSPFQRNSAKWLWFLVTTECLLLAEYFKDLLFAVTSFA